MFIGDDGRTVGTTKAPPTALIQSKPDNSVIGLWLVISSALLC